MEQLLAHIFGDFVLQSDWMAMNKNKKTLNCLVHVLVYTSVFLLLTSSWKALLVIGGTHFIIDRFPIIVKRLIWWKNHFPLMKYPPFIYCDTTGYYDDSPYTTRTVVRHNIKEHYKIDINDGNGIIEKYGDPRLFFITAWLYIVIDNFLHLTINYFALTYL